MIVAELKNWKSLPELKGFEPAFEYLENQNLTAVPVGKHAIHGESVFAIVQKAQAKPASQGKFEAHRKYVDVQYLVAGAEMICVAPASQSPVSEPYREDQDVAFYAPQNYERLEMQPGRFAVFFPEDAHMPNCELNGPGELHKVVVKLSVKLLGRSQ